MYYKDNEADFYVTDSKYPILMGYDIIKGLGLIVDAGNELIILKDRSYSYGRNNLKKSKELKNLDNFEVLETSLYKENNVEELISKSDLNSEQDKVRLRTILEKHIKRIKDTPLEVKDFKFSSRFKEEVPYYRSSPYPVPVAMMTPARKLIEDLENEVTIVVLKYPTML